MMSPTDHKHKPTQPKSPSSWVTTRFHGAGRGHSQWCPLISLGTAVLESLTVRAPRAVLKPQRPCRTFPLRGSSNPTSLRLSFARDHVRRNPFICHTSRISPLCAEQMGLITNPAALFDRSCSFKTPLAFYSMWDFLFFFFNLANAMVYSHFPF